MILTHGGNSISRGGGINPEKSFTLDIENFDTSTMKQGDLQFYGPGTKQIVDGKLRLSGGNALTRPLEDSLDYYFETEFNIIELSNWIYTSGRTFLQAGTYYTPFGVCFMSPYSNLVIKQGISFNTTWTSWGYTSNRYQSTNTTSLENIKFSERCVGNHYIQSLNDEKILELDTQIDFPNLTGDANYNTSTGNGLNKVGFVLENGKLDIVSMKFERYD